MMKVHLDKGHAFVVMGFKDQEQVFYLREPNLSHTKSQILGYAVLAKTGTITDLNSVAGPFSRLVDR